MRAIWEYFSTQRIVFGNGSIVKLESILKELRAKSILLVTDPGIKQSGIVDRVLPLLQHYQVYINDTVTPEPPLNTALACYQEAKSYQNIDVVIGLGGGSSIDMAKVVALLLTHDGHPLDYVGENKLPGPVLPLIAIPTTAGTGSEVTSVAVLTDVERQLKVGISDNRLRPYAAILDPELTLGLPAYTTACSGVDALSHAIEAYTAKPYKYIESVENPIFQGSSPITDVLALYAIELIASSLAISVHQGSNLEARENMLLASMISGLAFSNAGTALAHALAYPVGGLVKSPHGEITGLLLPYVMEFNSDVQTEKMTRIAKAFNMNVNGLTPNESALAAATAVTELLTKVGLSTKLTQIGIQESHIPKIVEDVLQINRLIRNNPKIPTKQNLTELLQRAL